jgi:hypothetical protein
LPSALHSYLPDCYPRYVASILAGNDLFRSAVGAAFPIFSTAYFHNLGVGPACSILGGFAVLLMPLPFILSVSIHFSLPMRECGLLTPGRTSLGLGTVHGSGRTASMPIRKGGS